MNNKKLWIRLNEDTDDYPYKNTKFCCNPHASKKHNHCATEKKSRVVYDTETFKCKQCGLFVSSNRELAGVNNRNHCPGCLWSRHMDLDLPGDRKSTCRSRMEPIGLTCKQVLKHYPQNSSGELMLIHNCTGCGKLSINRIAADDDAMEIYQIYLGSELLSSELKAQVLQTGITMLCAKDLITVQCQLFGRSEAIIAVLEPENVTR
jgi:hypothetical protein